MAERLASGRHSLTRDEVAANQKSRLYAALAEVMGEKGYSNTSVDDLIKHAKVSRATFYEHFDSKLDLFMCGYAGMQKHVVDAILSAPAEGTPMERFSVLLNKYLSVVAAHPPTARVYLLEVYAAGPDAMHHRIDLQQEFVAGVAKVFKARSKADKFACQALVAAISMLVSNALSTGGSAEVLALEKPVRQLAQRLFADQLVASAR
jgi:TetR/AcrR family transcriptional regulator